MWGYGLEFSFTLLWCPNEIYLCKNAEHSCNTSISDQQPKKQTVNEISPVLELLYIMAYHLTRYIVALGSSLECLSLIEILFITNEMYIILMLEAWDIKDYNVCSIRICVVGLLYLLFNSNPLSLRGWYFADTA